MSFPPTEEEASLEEGADADVNADADVDADVDSEDFKENQGGASKKSQGRNQRHHENSHQDHPDEQELEGNEERTQMGKIEMIPYLVVMDHRQKPLEFLRLEKGKSWIGGRGKKCHIQIKNPNASREHFKIQRIDHCFYALDMGSVNGTELNGEPLSSEEMQLLKSGDCLSAMDHNFRFEVRDGNYDKKMVQVISNAQEDPPLTHLAPYQHPNPNPYGNQQRNPMGLHGGHNVPALSSQPTFDPHSAEPPFSGDQSPISSSPPSSRSERRKKILMVCVCVLLIGVLLQFLDENKNNREKEEMSSVETESEKSFQNLSEDQKDMIQHSYQLAHNFYLQGRYKLASDQLEKIHHLVSSYKNSQSNARGMLSGHKD